MRRQRLISVVGGAAIVLGGAVALGGAPASAAPRHARAGDFDGDGVRDLALGAPGSDRVRVRYSHTGHVVCLHRTRRA